MQVNMTAHFFLLNISGTRLAVSSLGDEGVEDVSELVVGVGNREVSVGCEASLKTKTTRISDWAH